MLEKLVVIACTSAFLILLITKWGIREWMQINGWKLISEMFSCDFCLSFWANAIICLTLYLVTGSVVYLAIPAPATVITRMLI